jgi:hypothetical protein
MGGTNRYISRIMYTTRRKDYAGITVESLRSPSGKVRIVGIIGMVISKAVEGFYIQREWSNR